LAAVSEGSRSEIGPSVPAVFRTHGAYVLRVLRHLGVAEHELDDATQEVFVVVHRRLGEWTEDAPITTWLFAIARRVASDHRRRAARRREAPLEDAREQAIEPEQDRALARRDARAFLQRALEGVPDPARDVYVLHEIEQIPIAEVASMLGCPVQTAYSRLYVARRRVEAAVEGELGARKAAP
jgi:RNA polymerase sigma-70 factor (ECF subfamily)